MLPSIRTEPQREPVEILDRTARVRLRYTPWDCYVSGEEIL